jgi:hypothetical protein
MTWSVSISAANKAAAKRAVTRDLPKAMLHQTPHVHDFDVVRNAINGAIDACEEGTISISGSGHVNYTGDGDATTIKGVNIQLSVNSTTPTP